MKRSKILLVSNVLATVYSGYLLWTFGGAVIKAGGIEYIDALLEYFETAFSVLEMLGTSSATLTVLYVVLILLAAHIVLFVLGTIVGWLSFIGKKPGKGAAVLYLIGTLCFPVYLFFGLPVTIVAFVGSKKQKKINAEATAQAA